MPAAGIPQAPLEAPQTVPGEVDTAPAEVVEEKLETQAAGPSELPRDGAEASGKPSDTAAQKAAESAQARQAARGSAADGAIRVDVGLLDKLMNLVGELVLARNQILQYSNVTEDTGIVAPSQRLNLITTELQGQKPR